MLACEQELSTSEFMLRIGITYRAVTNYHTGTLSRFYRDPKRRENSWLNSFAHGDEIMQIYKGVIMFQLTLDGILNLSVLMTLTCSLSLCIALLFYNHCWYFPRDYV
jgi:hypothetical protein